MVYSYQADIFASDKKNKMKKYILLSAVIILSSSSSFAQQQEWCGSNTVLNQQILQNPEISQQREDFEIGFREYLNNNELRHNIDPTKKLIIPVVFHVIHEGGSENISKTQIQSQINLLNQCFNHQNADSVNTPPPFLALAGSLNVEFRLAKLDPQGNCTEGINRIYSNKTNEASNDNGVKSLSYWNSYSYLNIWVVKSIASDDLTILGYAQFPGSSFLSTDGLVILHNRIGNTGTSSTTGRTAVHEVGHWLNLIHIWGDDDCGSDQVNDTPAAFGPNFNVCYNQYPYFPTDTCDNTNPYGEMMVNYMDYSSDHCQNMFTQGQVERMRYVLEGSNGSNGLRSYLVSEDNLWATGTHDDYVGNQCAPIAHFTANKTFACTNTSINFEDESYNGTVTTRQWSFPGGNASSLTSLSPNVTYSSPGIYEVSLTVSNDIGSDTETKTSYIYITDAGAAQNASYTFYSDFESIDQFENEWIVINPDNKMRKWEIAGNLYTPSGGGALRVNNLDNTPTEYEELISPAYNLSNLQGPLKISYQYSGAATTYLGAHTNPFPFTVVGDAFKVYYSTNCGQSWTQINQLALSGSNLINAGLYTDFYVPNQNSIWGQKEHNLSSTISNSNNVRFKFRYEVGSGHGNNFYLDGIRIENVTGIEDIKEALDLQLFPNPTNGLTRLSLNAPESGKLVAELTDVLGRKITDIHSGTVGTGEQTFIIDVNDLDAGLYFVLVNYMDKNTAVKLIVQ